MTDAVAISIVTGVSSVAMAGISAYFAYRAKAVAKETHEAVNSRMDEFKRVSEKLFHAQGVTAGIAQEKHAKVIRQTTETER